MNFMNATATTKKNRTHITIGVVAGAYKTERSLSLYKTHLVQVESYGEDSYCYIKTCSRVKLDHLADQYSAESEDALDARPTCEVCGPRWDKLK